MNFKRDCRFGQAPLLSNHWFAVGSTGGEKGRSVAGGSAPTPAEIAATAAKTDR